MLVLSRKPQEKILIGENIEITIVAVRGRRVKVGISCPPEISIHRSEVYERIQQAQTEGLQSVANPSARLA